jgi:DNA-binding FadR family transcriptional regulator
MSLRGKGTADAVYGTQMPAETSMRRSFAIAQSPRREPAAIGLSKRLGVQIVTGEYCPGDTLPTEFELAAQFGVARSVVREATKILSAKGLLVSRQKSGTRLRERSAWNLLDPDLLAWMFEGAPPLEFVRSLFQLRMIIEPAAAELAAVGRSSRQLSQMGHALEIMSEKGLTTDEGQEADHKFHKILLEATANELLVSLSSTIAATVRWSTYFKYNTKLPARDPIPQHQALFEAIAKANPAAAREATETLIRQAQLDTEAALDV